MNYKPIFDVSEAIEQGDANTVAREAAMIGLHSALECALDNIAEGGSRSAKHHVLSALGYLHAIQGLGVIHVQQSKKD
jgi:hypothetical protein